MLDYLITGATVIDGTGKAPLELDVGIKDGRIEVLSPKEELKTVKAESVLSADGLMVTPGIIDPHTHYDAQLFWDPTASPSNLHGVTTIIGGNCGFTLAPINDIDADYIRSMMAKVEGMPLGALESGVPWNWSSFGEYLESLESAHGGLGVNAGFLVGHCALRRNVLGEEHSGREADAEEIRTMSELLARSLDEGGLGFSSSQSRTHSDGAGEPISSRNASREEMLAFCNEVARHVGTTLEYITNGCLDTFSDDEVNLMVAMSASAQRPLNWNLLTVDARSPEKAEHQLEASSKAQATNAQIVALTMPTLVPMNMSFLNHCALFLIPGWGEVLNLALKDRIAALKDPATRSRLDAHAHSKEAGVFRRLSGWSHYVIGDTYGWENEGLSGRSVGDIATERHSEAFDTLLDIVIADELRTVLWPIPEDRDEATWALRAQIWEDPRAMVGGSDAGAHLDRMCGSNYPTAFLADCLRGRKLVPVEKAVHMMTTQPASLFGLKTRGRVEKGMFADLMVFDPKLVDSKEAHLVFDLPGDTPRLFAESKGVVRVIVNGTETIKDGVPTNAVPGKVLRSSTDTRTVTPKGA